MNLHSVSKKNVVFEARDARWFMSELSRDLAFLSSSGNFSPPDTWTRAAYVAWSVSSRHRAMSY